MLFQFTRIGIAKTYLITGEEVLFNQYLGKWSKKWYTMPWFNTFLDELFPLSMFETWVLLHESTYGNNS